MPYAQHRLGRTHYTRKGRGSKLPVVWLHGGPGGQHRPDSPVFSLAEGRSVYCYTQIGGGRSSATDRRHWNIQTFVAELKHLVDHWGLGDFHLMGGSWGTTLALEYYLKHGARRVQSLVFQSPLFNSQDWKRDAQQLIAALPRETREVIHTCHRIGATDAGVYRDAMLEFYRRHVLRSRRKLQAMMGRRNPNGARIYQYMWGPSEFEPTGTLKDYDRVAALSSIGVPCLLICGEFDEARPETGSGYADRIPDCRFLEIKGASHVIWEEKPRQLQRAIQAFLAEVEG